MDRKLIDITDDYIPLSSEEFALLDASEKSREFKRLQWANQRVNALQDRVNEIAQKREQQNKILVIDFAKRVGFTALFIACTYSVLLIF